MEYSKSLAYQWTLYLDSCNYSYQFDTEKGIIIIPDVKVNSTSDALLIYIGIGESDFELRCIFPQKTATAFRAQITQLLMRINYTITFGNFYMDYSDGEVGYKYSADFEGSVASVQMLHNAMSFATSLTDKWGTVIMEVSSGKASPMDAFSKYN